MPRRGWTSAFLLLATAACPQDNAPNPDAAIDAQPRIDTGRPDATQSVLSVDFTAGGCFSLDPAGPTCTGRAPLTLSFVPVSTSPVVRFLWDFGDGTAKSSERTTSHTFTRPGSYDVTLVGAASSGGSVTKSRPGFVVILANDLGSACDVDGQCESGLSCLCGSAMRCPLAPAFVRGICTSPCRDTICREPALCADLTLGAGTMPEAWRSPLCVRPCTADKDCATGMRCRDLPGRFPAGSWIKACFPDVPGDPGTSCRSSNGQLRDDLCLSGKCADLGALGLCSLECKSTTCPPGTACAELGDGRSLCLRACNAAFTCAADPLLACAAPDPSGPLGFRVPEGPVDGQNYCAPRRCATAIDCGPTGSCMVNGTGSQCARWD